MTSKLAPKCEDIGERNIVRQITSLLDIRDRDDCAILEVGKECLVWTADMLHRKTDFPPRATPWQIGWMSVAVNLSDIASMGAEPLGLLMATGMPPETEISFVEELFRGFEDCAKAYNTRILGGDVDSHEELTITGTALGKVERDLVLRRSGARPGDLLCTTGSLGSAGAGLKLALRKEEKYLEGWEKKLERRLLEPNPRMEEGRSLALSRSVTSMMDNSDGLSLSLFDLAEASSVGFVVQEKLLPIDPVARKIASTEYLTDLALHAGGDFELVFTVRPDRLDLAENACDFTIIGKVLEKGIWLESEGGTRPIEPLGYDHMH